jgi:cobalamin-dependent methionine synthase I
LILIGEGIHVISREIGRAMAGRDPGPILALARRQAEAGADYLDLNLGPLTRNGPDTARWAVETVQAEVDLPLSIDTPNHEAMRAALEICRRPPLINSAAGTIDGRENMLPLAAEFKADVVLLTITDQGLPADAEERADLALDMVDQAAGLGIAPEKMWIDGALLPAPLNQEQIAAYVEFAAMVPDLAPGARTVTGLSNVSSCGVPADLRGLLNRTLFLMLDRVGHSAVIADVLDAELVALSRGQRPELSDLVGWAWDDDGLDRSSLSSEEAAYAATVDIILGRKLYGHDWLDQ